MSDATRAAILGLLMITTAVNAAPTATADGEALCFEPYPAQTHGVFNGATFDPDEARVGQSFEIEFSFDYIATQFAWSLIPITTTYQFLETEPWLTVTPSETIRYVGGPPLDPLHEYRVTLTIAVVVSIDEHAPANRPGGIAAWMTSSEGTCAYEMIPLLETISFTVRE